jgi:hypothetical protein
MGDALMRRVNSRTQTPIPATVLIVVVGFVLMGALPGGDMPVVIGALLWSGFVVFVLVSPPVALTAVWISVGVLVAGGMYLAYLLMFNREVLETEPGDVSVFTH